jgi:putative DNA primase/helicase
MKLVPLVINKRHVADLQQAMMAEVLVSSPQIPCWINGVQGPDPSNLIVFQNGILNVPLFIRGGGICLQEASIDYFNTTALPVPFKRTAKCPVWDYYLKSSLGDDPDKIDLLQEWFGYCMTSDNSFHKMLYMRGPSASGKGVALNVLHDLVGEGQAATLDFASLSADFGLHPLVGKLVGLIWDARTPRSSDAMRGLERLLNITGGDSVSINRKFKDQLGTFKLPVRITLASNSFLDIPDHAGATLRRLNILEFSTSFAENPDLTLGERLKQELTGIAAWGLVGLRRLHQQGKFTVPKSSRLALQEWKIRTSPTAEFILECTDPNGEVLREELYEAWVAWSQEHGISHVTKSSFYERLRSAAPHAVGDAYEKDGRRWVVFRGISLQAWSARKFLGKM